MRFHLPRRHRRPLLFPPGLLALAGLLLLGCVALGRWEPALRRYNVMQLTMPVLPLPTDTSKASVRFDVPSLAKVRAMGPWRDNYFTGKPDNILREHSHIAAEIHAMMADSGQRGRVRVRLASTAHYKDLVFLLDLMNRENVKKYWLDIVHKPTIFYAFTDVIKPDDYKNNVFICGNIFMRYSEPIPPPIPFWTRFGDGIASFWYLVLMQPLSQLVGLILVMLFLTIVLSGCWRITRQYTA